MSEVPVYKFTVALYHKMYSSWWMPYWLSAFLLRFYLVQVGSDKFVWNNKVFKKEIHYNLKTEADAALLKWREWYS